MLFRSEQEKGAAEIAARRGGRLLNLDRILLHSPPDAVGWNGFLGAVRGQLRLPAGLRELAVCAVAALNLAEYEYRHHAPEFIAAGGSRQQLDALAALGRADFDSSRFDESQRAVLDLTLEMTRTVAVSDGTFARVRGQLNDDRQLVELVGVVAADNMVSRFLVALGIEPEGPAEGSGRRDDR